MKDNNFYKLIENGNDEKKNKSWRSINNDISAQPSDEIQYNGSNTAVLSRPKIFFVSGAVLAVAIALILFFCLYDFTKNNSTRYYSTGEYTAIVSDSNLKEYSEQNGLSLFYFDWYEQTEYFYDTIYTDNETGETICFEEIIASESGYLITLYVKESDVDIDFLDFYADLCTTEYVGAANIVVYYGGSSGSAYAMFEYENYSYYLNIPYLEDTSDILVYVDTLINE